MTRQTISFLKAGAIAWFLASVCFAQNPADQRFRRLDRNNDGKLARDEWRENADLFDRIDIDRDGFVTLEEDREFRRLWPVGSSPELSAPPRDPEFANEKYGPGRRNVFDLWQAESQGRAPLAIYYHEGNFQGGDKSTINAALLARLLGEGISVAAVNYRLSGMAPFPAQMHDAARALQYLRSHAYKYNIDPQRIGAIGGSAGAGISLWLAFHEDMADPDSPDPLARQSTRLSCVVGYNGQTSYDPRFIQSLFDTNQADGRLIHLFGLKSAEDVSDSKSHALFEEASPINHATEGDPPVLLFYTRANTPLAPNSVGSLRTPHPKFGFVLKEKLDQLGVECLIKLSEEYADETTRRGPVDDYVAFFVEKLKSKS